MRNIKILSFLIIILIFSSCNEGLKVNNNLKPSGVWKQIGYGNIIDLNDSIIKVYDITKQNCNLSKVEEILDFGRIKNYTKDTLIIQHGIDNWKFIKLKKLPELCSKTIKVNNDPKHNFQSFWDTFNEHYSSFEIKGINWKAVYDKYEPTVSKKTTNVELYAIFQEMIALLNDGHVKMEMPEIIKEDYEKQITKKEKKYSKLEEFQLNKEIAEFYVDSLRNYNAGTVRYGIINKNVGYLQINAMFALADYNLPQDLDFRSFWGKYWEKADNIPDEIKRENEVAGINAVLDVIIQELSGVESYILDLRFNNGGKDGVALAILNHFATTEKVLFTKKARLEDEFTKKQEIAVVPSEHNFTGNVYLLTSNNTASASEILVLGSLELPNFVKIGSQTIGEFSSTLDKTLPNGWEYEFSNEVYQDLEGNSYENIGISPDYGIMYSNNRFTLLDQLTKDLKNKKDRAIDLALKLEKEK